MMSHQLTDLGWVDLDFGCMGILASGSAVSTKMAFAQAELGRYWVTHLLADLGRVDFDLGCSTGRWAVLQLQ